MATYLEIFGLRDDSDLRSRTAVAVVVEATAVKDETTPVAARIAWAQEALSDPESVAKQALWVILAENKNLSVATIQGATDASLQTNVASVVDLLAGAPAV